MRHKIEERIVHIEKEMENEVTEEYQKHMIETLRELSSDDNGANGDRRKKMWKLLTKNIISKLKLQFLWEKRMEKAKLSQIMKD